MNSRASELLRQSYLLFRGRCHRVVLSSIAIRQSTKPIEKLNEVFAIRREVECMRDNSVSPLPFEEPDTIASVSGKLNANTLRCLGLLHPFIAFVVLEATV